MFSAGLFWLLSAFFQALDGVQTVICKVKNQGRELNPVINSLAEKYGFKGIVIPKIFLVMVLFYLGGFTDSFLSLSSSLIVLLVSVSSCTINFCTMLMGLREELGK